MMSSKTEENIWRSFAMTLIAGMICLLSLIFVLVYCIRKDKFTRVMVNSDFIPITGGNVKRCSGGVLTYLYIILVTSLTVTFLIRYLYFNHLIEVLPLSYSKTKTSLESSYKLKVNLIGYNGLCLDETAPQGDPIKRQRLLQLCSEY